MVHNTIYISVHIYDAMLIGFTIICIYNKSYEGKCRDQDREKHSGKPVYFQLNTNVFVTQGNFPCQTFMLRFGYMWNLAEERATNVQHGVGSIRWIAWYIRYNRVGTACTLRGCVYKSLARPGRKQSTATRLGIYSTYSPRSSIHFLARCSNFCKSLKKNQKVVRPTRSPRQQWPPRRTINGDLSIVFFSPGKRWQSDGARSGV